VHRQETVILPKTAKTVKDGWRWSDFRARTMLP